MKNAYGGGMEDILRARRQQVNHGKSQKPNPTVPRTQDHGRAPRQNGKVQNNRWRYTRCQHVKMAHGIPESIEDDSQ